MRLALSSMYPTIVQCDKEFHVGKSSKREGGSEVQWAKKLEKKKKETKKNITVFHNNDDDDDDTHTNPSVAFPWPVWP